jgi:hypothetical protein
MESVVKLLIDGVEAIFAIGAVGSLVVMLLVGLEDCRTVLEPDAVVPDDQLQS